MLGCAFRTARLNGNVSAQISFPGGWGVVLFTLRRGKAMTITVAMLGTCTICSSFDPMIAESVSATGELFPQYYPVCRFVYMF